MIWKPYRMTFQLKSPLHIGYHEVGNLLRTRYYVTGRVIWGALTAQLTRQDNKQNYEKVVDQVNSSIKFSYFYPTLNPNNLDEVLYPRFDPDPHEQKMVFGKGKQGITQEKFEGLFLTSYASTALNPFQSSAEEGSLHEVECLSPFIQQDDGVAPVYLLGYLFLKAENDELLQKIKNVLDRLQLGGERAYGFGKVTGNIVSLQPDELFFGLHELILSDDSSPLIQINQNSNPKLLLAHTLTKGLTHVSGDIEPVVGREWKRDIKKYTLTEGKVCWTPGSVISDEKKTFEITKYSFWEAR